VLHVTTFTIFRNSQSVTLRSTYLITLFFYRTVSARASSFLPLPLVYQDATLQTNLIFPHHASPETCPVQRWKFFCCVTGNLRSCNVYTLLIFNIILKYILFFYWRYNPLWVCILQPSSGAITSSFSRFLDHTQRRSRVGRTPLDEWSVRRRDLYMTTYNTHNR